MKTYTEEEVRLLLAEQHRNTRHDAVDEILAVRNKFDTQYKFPPATGDMINQMSGAIINLKQRSPQNILDVV